LDEDPLKVEPNRPRVKTGGRKKGSLNKVTKDIKLLSRPYTAEAVETLASVMRIGETHAVRVAAAKELLDRAWGKSSQPVEHSGNVDIAMTLDRVISAARERARLIHLDTPPVVDAIRH
jgi:hypothetical protein